MSDKNPSQLKISPSFLFFLTAILLVVFLYGNTLKVPFVFDDLPNIVENNSLHWNKPLSVSKIVGSLASHRPLSNLTFGLNYYFGKLNVKGYHLVNISLHILNTLLLFHFLNLIFKFGLPEQKPIHTVYLASIISLLWAASPVQTQAVNYIVQRMTLLACFFYLLGLIAYIKARTTNSTQKIYWFILTFIFGGMTLLSKENTLFFPLTCLIIDYFFISNFHWEMFKRFLIKISPFLIWVVFFVLAYILYHPEIRNIFLHRSNSQTFTIWERVMTEWRILVYYLSLLLFPLPDRLFLDYLYPVSKSLFQPATTITSLLFIVLSLGWAVKKVRLFPLLSFGLLWFFINLLVESTFIPIDLIFEHRLYLPSIGFFMFVILVTHQIIQKIDKPTAYSIGFVFFPILILISGFLSVERNKTWNNEIVLFEKVAQKYPDLYRVHISLAMIYQKKGLLDKAEQEYYKAIQIRPAYAAIHNDFATILWKKGDYKKAEEEFKKTIELNPEETAPYVNLGKLYAETGNPDLGIKEIETTLKKHPHKKAYLALGEIYESQNKMEEAKQAYRKALELNSKFSEPFAHLGAIFVKTGDFKTAEGFLKKGLMIDPESEELHQKLGIVYQNQGLLDNALEEYIKTMEINPDNKLIHFNIGSLFQQKGDIDIAVSEYEKGTGVTPPKEMLLLYKQAFSLTRDPELQTRLTHLMKNLQN